MPHLWVEYSANLEKELDVAEMLETMQKAAIGDGTVFPLAGARTRGVKVDNYYIVDGNLRNSFVHVIFRIAPGRSVEDRKEAGSRMFRALKELTAPIMEKRPLGLSIQIEEADETVNLKANNYKEYLAK